MDSRRFYQLWEHVSHFLDFRDYIDVEAGAESIRSNVRFRGPNIAILFCAIVIASVGLNVNSIPVIIGAMLISPLMSPIMGLGLALGVNDTRLLNSSIKNLVVMVGISILASTLFFLISPLYLEHPTELLARTNPTIYDVLIALFGGFAGIIETSRKKQGTVIVGVAIATALMPPLCTVGYGLASWDMSVFLGALYLFFINLSFIALASLVGVKILHYPVEQGTNPIARRRNRVIVSVFLIALVVPSILSGITMIRETNFTRSANAFVAANKSHGRSYVYDYKVNSSSKPATVELYIAGEALEAADYADFYTSALEYGIHREQIVFHQDAAYTNPVVDENQVVRDILRHYEDLLKERQQTIDALNRRIDSLQQTISLGQSSDETR